MRTRVATPTDREHVITLIACFRVELALFRNVIREPDPAAAEQELAEYDSAGYPVYIAEDPDCRIAGYLVCRVDGDVVWAESLFVLPAFRRKGVGAALYAEAERLAEERGGYTLYNWIHPNNDAIIMFLKKRGYSVLNLIELRRARPGETTTQQLSVGRHEFDY